MNAPLSDNHRRTISTTLGLLDEFVCRAEAQARGRGVRSVLYEMSNNLSAQQRRELLAQVRVIRQALQQLKTDLRLNRRREDAGTDLWSRASILWEELAELDSRRLRGYGEVSPALSRYLDPRIQALSQQVQRLADIARAGRSADTDEHDPATENPEGLR